MITAPGFFFDMPEPEYRADPCVSPSLTQSLAKIIIERSPLHAWTAHPRLNPDFEPDDDTKFDIGNICHRILIGRGKVITVLPFDDWRTKDARAAREAAAAAGQLAVLGRHYEQGSAIVNAAWKQLKARKLAHMFAHGAGEVVMAWKEGPLWLRQMLDWLTKDRATVIDYKTTDRSAAPHAIARNMVEAGWDVQAAMAERGLRALDGHDPRLRFLFVNQEVQPPFALSVVELSESVLTMGRKKLDVAINLWRRCVADNHWPGYPTDVVVPEYPAWAEAQWLTREETEFTGGYDTLAEKKMDLGNKFDRLTRE